jgi:putative spermidine/putrescine transport system permease protein
VRPSLVIFRLSVSLIFVFLVTPIVFVVFASFNESALLTFPPDQFTLQWYGKIPRSFFEGLQTSIVLGISVSALSTLLGTPAALAIVKGRFPGRRFLNTLTMSPLMVPALVIGVSMFQFFNWIWDITGVSLGGHLIGLVLGHSAFTIPYVVRSVVAGLAHFDPFLEEAAMNLGATPVQTFFRVTFPQLLPGITAGAIFAFLTSFDDVPVALFLSGAEATTLPIKIFTSIEFSFNPAVMALASSVIYGSVALMVLLHWTIGLDKFFGAVRA